MADADRQSEARLESLGWDSGRALEFAGLAAEDGLVPARISMETKLNYLVWTAAAELPAKVTGRLLHDTKRDPLNRPKVGDWVGVVLVDNGERAQIRALLPRRTLLTRKVVGRRNEGQVVATNLDTVFVVQGLDDNFNLRRLERCLVMVHEGGAEPVILLNKADLRPDAAAVAAEAVRVAGGTPVLLVSAETGAGMAQLDRWMRPGRTVAFIGSSGVGKSTLINRLCGEEVQDTADVRERDSKGRHTTVRRELFFLGDRGVVVDTPGMREFHLWFAEDGLDAAFADIEAIAGGCRFNDCSHTNEPDCAVLAAVGEGTLAAERHRNFLRLQEDLAKLNRNFQRRMWRDKAAGSFARTRAPRPHKRGGR
jgi:ribosome biogenesis GTPase